MSTLDYSGGPTGRGTVRRFARTAHCALVVLTFAFAAYTSWWNASPLADVLSLAVILAHFLVYWHERSLRLVSSILVVLGCIWLAIGIIRQTNQQTEIHEKTLRAKINQLERDLAASTQPR